MSKRDELAAVLRDLHWHEDYPGLDVSDMDPSPWLPQADAVLAWLGGQFDEGLREAVAAPLLADAWPIEDARDAADAALGVMREHLGLSDAAQDAQDGAVGPGSVRMGTGEGAAPNGAQIEDFEGMDARAAWRAAGSPAICPRCGGWDGPTLPFCTDGDHWDCDNTCAVYRYTDDLCHLCQVDEGETR